MFDDKPTNPTPGQGTPANLPTGGPAKPEETKFQAKPLDKLETKKSELPAEPLDKLETEPEDILAGVDKVEPAVKGPAQPISPLPSQPGKDFKTPLPPAVAPPEKPVTKEPFFKQHKKAFVIIVVVVLGGAALAIGGWYGYQLLVSSEPTVVNTGQGQPSANVNRSVNANEPVVNQNAGVNQNVNEPPPLPVDTDRDGLTDEEEELYGTDPNKVDTDQDGLTDRDEVKVFKTDPNNPDTDNDGFLDGEEVRAGYDPKGPGRLLRIE